MKMKKIDQPGIKFEVPLYLWIGSDSFIPPGMITVHISSHDNKRLVKKKTKKAIRKQKYEIRRI